MKRVRVTTASFGESQRQLAIESPLTYKDYSIDTAFYNNFNTKSRENSLHTRLKGKIPKMMEWLSFPDYDYYIWVDSRFTLREGFLEAIFRFENEDADLFLFNHPDRSTIRDELEFMNLHMNDVNSPLYFYLNIRYHGELINEQVELYLQDTSFYDHQLFSMGCFMYSKRIVTNSDYNLMSDWYLHNSLYSIQDQLSFPYLLHKHQVKFKVYPDNLINNSFMKYS
ncbi:glycosyltransferase domain-containing protein [Pedobacter sp. AW31-3R]|uniref:glycosyltransferase domain-containing protein n=1 Tax=Pedobacter sp. AW31-3R TaxID=3445781 RepID=UPI003F9F4FE0